MSLRLTNPSTPDSPDEPGAPSATAPRPGRAGPLPSWLGRLGEPLYRAAINRRNRRYDSGRGVTRLPLPVISVGNLSVGGTGKTPMVMHILRLLLEHGHRPCVAMRGYSRGGRRRVRGARRSGLEPGTSTSDLIIDQIRHEQTRFDSDEADAYRRAFDDLPIVSRPDRLAGLRVLLEEPFQPRVDCVVLDDGFQHRRIARNADIVLIDASRPPMHDHLLPRGWLREPAESLARATAVVLTHTELCRGHASDSSLVDLSTFIVRHHGRPPLATTSHVWTGLRRSRSDGTEDDRLPLDYLLGKRVVAACAIGNPHGFIAALERTLTTDRSNPGTLAARFVLPDHDPFDDAVRRIIAGAARQHEADAIVVTDKDWSKLRPTPLEGWPCPILRPELSLVFNSGLQAFERHVLDASRRLSLTPAADPSD